jgi:hypothetical protein
MPDLAADVLVRKMEAERNFAAAAFSKPDLVMEQCSYITREMFSNERLGQFWENLRRMRDPGQAALEVDPALVLELMQTSEGYFLAYDFAPLGNALANEYWFYQSTHRLSDLARAIGEGSLEAARRIARVFGEEAPVSYQQVPDLGTVGLEFINVLEDGEKRTIPMGVSKLDRAFGGWWQESLYIVAARPGVGKTAFLWQAARNAAAAGKRALFVSLEMSAIDLFARAACGIARVSYRDVLARRITDNQREHINIAANRLMDVFHDSIYIDDSARMTTDDLWNRVATVRPDIVFTDHLRLFADGLVGKGEREDQRLGRVSWAHKQLAKEFRIPVVAAAQLNRNVEARQDKLPTLSDLRDSGQIEENADVVIGIHRDREYVEGGAVETPAVMAGLKFRNGPDIKVNLTFNGLRQWFGEKGVDDVDDYFGDSGTF